MKIHASGVKSQPNSWQAREDRWESMTINENRRRPTTIHENQWQWIGISEHQWNQPVSLTIDGNQWQSIRMIDDRLKSTTSVKAPDNHWVHGAASLTIIANQAESMTSDVLLGMREIWWWRDQITRWEHEIRCKMMNAVHPYIKPSSLGEVGGRGGSL